MKVLTKAPRGTQDILPSQTKPWQNIENLALKTAEQFGFFEIRIPTFEHTELFSRSVGDTTDVVQKEMFTFEDRGGRSLSLRPEGTAGVVRSVLETGIINDALPLKVCYITSCFRNERPQAGRYKEFHQFGVELFGPESPAADAEVISLAQSFFDKLNLKEISLEINSIGCKKCRADYQNALKEYYEKNKEALCDTCLERLEKNPMRLLDCKSERCSKLAKDAPKVLDYLCDDCDKHFEQLKELLTNQGIEFTINPSIVRGLDYYSRTVFEFISNDLGAQSTICGGGRYDGLIETMGGKPTPALGFGMGLERLMLVLKAQENPLAETQKSCDLYIGTMGDGAKRKAAKISSDIRKQGFSVQTDLMGRSVKAQMKYADKIGAKASFIIGDSELESGKANLKRMEDGQQKEINLDDFTNELKAFLEG